MTEVYKTRMAKCESKFLFLQMKLFLIEIQVPLERHITEKNISPSAIRNGRGLLLTASKVIRVT